MTTQNARQSLNSFKDWAVGVIHLCHSHAADYAPAYHICTQAPTAEAPQTPYRFTVCLEDGSQPQPLPIGTRVIVNDPKRLPKMAGTITASENHGGQTFTTWPVGVPVRGLDSWKYSVQFDNGTTDDWLDARAITPTDLTADPNEPPAVIVPPGYGVKPGMYLFGDLVRSVSGWRTQAQNSRDEADRRRRKDYKADCMRRAYAADRNADALLPLMAEYVATFGPPAAMGQCIGDQWSDYNNISGTYADKPPAPARTATTTPALGMDPPTNTANAMFLPITQGKDTRDGSAYWLVKLADRIPNFKAVNTRAHSHSGGWSKFADGFLFRVQANAERFAGQTFTAAPVSEFVRDPGEDAADRWAERNFSAYDN